VSNLDSPGNEMRNKVQRVLAANPAMPKRGEILTIELLPWHDHPLEITVAHGDGVTRTWRLTFEEVES
jgi:hypothetical protein